MFRTCSGKGVLIEVFIALGDEGEEDGRPMRRRNIEIERNRPGWESWNVAIAAAWNRVLVLECDGHRYMSI